jgi:adenylate cyclase
LPSHEPFVEAELQAELTVALLRIGASVTLAAVFALAVLGSGPPSGPVLARQWLYGGGTMLAYLLLGLVSWLLNRRGLYRTWMAWPVVSGDAAFMLANVWLALDNTGLPSGYMALLPTVWLAPLVLAAGALRYNPALQAYLLVLLCGGLVAIASVRSGDPEAASDAETLGRLQLFYGLPPDLTRLTMLSLAGLILVLAATRARRLLTRAIAETRRRTNLTRYLPEQLADRLADSEVAELRRGRRQTAAIMFADIRGFTHLAETCRPRT